MSIRRWRVGALAFALISFVACGDGGDGGSPTGDPADAADTGGDDDAGTTGPIATDVDCSTNADCEALAAELGACQLALCDNAVGVGVCFIVTAEDGAPCEDGDACTLQSACDAGACVGAEAAPDCDDGNPCTSDLCDPAVGCVNDPAEGEPCSDGDPCTTNDLCTEGQCVGTPSGACTCEDDTDCELFEDGDWCNGVLTCLGGECQVDPATVVTCEDPEDPCLAAACAPATGACEEVPAADGAACDDGDPCTADDTCSGGTCGGEPACNCETDDDCVPVDDDDLCNGTLVCGDEGVCVPDPATMVTCEDDDGDDCQAPVCEPSTGDCVPAPVPDGTSCGTDNPCVVSKVCDDGFCVGGTDLDCDDGNPCTNDLCVPLEGCEHQAASGQPCDDGDPCTSDDLCEFDTCIGATILCECGDGFCSVTEQQGCFCEADCGSCTECGDGVCDPGEDVDCPQDCPVDACGDGVCEADEVLTCPQDCDGGGGGGGCGDGVCDPFGEVLICPQDCCGDGACDPLFEDINSCPEDCGPQNDCGNDVCEFPVEDLDNCPEDCAVCGDGECSATEDIDTCAEDCTPNPVCGDGICDEQEDAAHCPADCAPPDEEDAGAEAEAEDDAAVVDDDADVTIAEEILVDDDASDVGPVPDDDVPGVIDAVEDTGPTADDAEVVEETLITTDLTLTTTDGKALAARSWRLSTTPDGAPGVLLVHQFNSNKEQWDAYVADLTALGWIVLAFDLRGHGASDAADGPLTDLLSDPAQAPVDVQAALAWLVGDGAADAGRIAIIGTSIGANLACVASANDYGVKIPVAVSARDTAVADLAAKAIEDLAFSGLLILATEEDGGGVQAATALQFVTQSAAPTESLVLPGSAHGKDLLEQHPEAWTAVVDFVGTHL